MSFAYSTAVEKPSETKKALDAQRDQHLKGETYDATRARAGGADTAADQRAEVEDLSTAAHDAAAAAVRKLNGSSYRISVSGHRDVDGTASISVSVTAAPSG